MWLGSPMIQRLTKKNEKSITGSFRVQFGRCIFEYCLLPPYWVNAMVMDRAVSGFMEEIRNLRF